MFTRSLPRLIPMQIYVSLMLRRVVTALAKFTRAVYTCGVSEPDEFRIASVSSDAARLAATAHPWTDWICIRQSRYLHIRLRVFLLSCSCGNASSRILKYLANRYRNWELLENAIADGCGKVVERNRISSLCWRFDDSNAYISLYCCKANEYLYTHVLSMRLFYKRHRADTAASAMIVVLWALSCVHLMPVRVCSIGSLLPRWTVAE